MVDKEIAAAENITATEKRAAALKSVRDTIMWGIADAKSKGYHPSRLYIGRNQFLDLVAELEYYGGLRADAATSTLPDQYLGLQVFLVAADNHLYIASTAR